MKRSKKRSCTRLCAVALAISAWLCATALYHTHKPLPDSLDYKGATVLLDDRDLEFIYDLTCGTGNARTVEQHIFDRIFAAVDNAQRYVLIDMFLFNSYGAKGGDVHRDLSRELSDMLVSKKKENPGISIDFITDPINTVYGGGQSPEIKRLLDAGINVVITDLHKLRDSNFIYSAIWRTLLQWLGKIPGTRWLNHPFSGDQKVLLGGWFDLLNFKANHRKVVVADHRDDMVTIVTSANPHGPSSLHGNVAFVIRGDIWDSVYETEQGVAAMSGGRLSRVDLPLSSRNGDGSVMATLLTENRIKAALLDSCRAAGPSDVLSLAQFYLADRDIVDALLEASKNGAKIRIILDPNRDAFGYRKNGIPNRQTGFELKTKSHDRIDVRWYDTRGEQFHTKLFIRESGLTMSVISGSANLTRRNLDNYNLEIAVALELDRNSANGASIRSYFERIWTNGQGGCSVDFETYRDDSVLKYTLYRLQEGLGLGTF